MIRQASALFLFVTLALLLFGMPPDPRAVLLDGGADAYSFVWFLEWWPWSIGHGLNPLVTHLIWFPKGYNLAWATPVPTAALLALPITCLLNAVASYNLLILLAPATAAWTAYLLAARITRDWAASVTAGILFGFSAYVAGQMHGHLNLALSFLIPLAVLVVLRRAGNELTAGGLIARLAVIATLQFGLSVEVFASGCVFASVALGLHILAAPRHSRRAAIRLAAEVALSVLIAGMLVSPYLIEMEAGRSSVPGFVNPPHTYSTDIANLVVPTANTWLSPGAARAIASRFPGNGSEQGGYLGLPLIVILVMYFLGRPPRPMTRVLLPLLLVVAIASLGPSLWVAGYETGTKLPWLPMTHLPLIRGALPSRFSLYVALAASLAAASWLATARTRSGRRQRLALGLVACVVILPASGSPAWQASPRLPFFSPANIRAALGRNPNLLILPYGDAGAGMLWQAQSGMAFTQSGGNLSFVPNDFQHQRILPTLYGAPPTEVFANDMTAFCVENRVTAVIAGPGTPASLATALDGLPWVKENSGGVRLYRVPKRPLRYVAFGADYWPGLDVWGVMGRRMTVVSHGGPGRLRLSAALRPRYPVSVTMSGDGAPRVLVVSGSIPLDIAIPADVPVTFAADKSFVPDTIWHNGDRRVVSLLATVSP